MIQQKKAAHKKKLQVVLNIFITSSNEWDEGIECAFNIGFILRIFGPLGQTVSLELLLKSRL